jgi:hypothetical protein
MALAAPEAPLLPGEGLVGYYDAATYKTTDGKIWKDLSPLGNTASTLIASTTPAWKSQYGGYFKFEQGDFFKIPYKMGISKSNVFDYTVFWCGVEGRGDDYGGISRGNSWTSGNHLMGWRRGAVYSDWNVANNPRPFMTNRAGDNFCLASTHKSSKSNSEKRIHQYFNGEFLRELRYSTWSTTPAGNAWVVGHRSNGQHQYTGGIGVVLIYNRALTPVEIRDLQARFGPRYGL